MRLLADFMLGKLARELRLLGIDCAYEKDTDSYQLLKKAKSIGGVILTRNTKLKDKESVVFIKSEKVVEQISQVLSVFANLTIRPMTRCLDCGTTLEARDKASVKSKVPLYVYRTQERFYSCPSCQKIDWRGTHYEDMQRRVDQYLKIYSEIKGQKPNS